MPDRFIPSWLAPVLRPLWPLLRILAAQSLFINLLALALPVFVLQVYDRVVFHAGLGTLEGLVIGMGLVLAFDFVLRQARGRLMQGVSLRVDAWLGARVYDKLAALPLHSLESRPGSHWWSLFRDVELVRNLFGGPTAVLMMDLPFVMLFVALVAVVAAPVLWVLMIVIALYVVLGWWSSHAIQSAGMEEAKAIQARDALVGEIVAGRATVKGLALGDALRPMWEDRHADAMRRALARGTRQDIFGNAGTAATILVTVVLTSVGALAILDQRMTIGALIAANLLSARIVGPLNQLVGAWRGFAAYRESARRLGEFFALAEEKRETALRLDRPVGAISLERVTFRFGDAGRPVLEGLDLTLKPGGLHGVIGRNGSGKSTLLKLMMGLYPPGEGRVLLDGADIRQFTRADLARWIGYVPQEIFLFAGTVRHNLCIASPQTSDERVLAVTRMLGLHDDIADLPQGYDADIGEAGRRLSAGQRQKIAIARALMADPAVLLLDEPTANLDRPAEEKLRAALTALAADRNVVVVTHSPILLAACSNLIVLDKGGVVAAGSPVEVMPRLFGGQGTPPPLERKV